MLSAANKEAVAALRSTDASRGAGAGTGAGTGASLSSLSTETSRSFILALSLSFGNQIPRIVAGPRFPGVS